MKYSTRSTRRHRNPHQIESKSKKPFFGKTNDVTIQNKEDQAFFQPQLKIGRPNDQYEQEADQVADAVVNQGPSDQTAVQQKAEGIQKMDASKMEEDKAIQEKAAIQKMGEAEEEPAQMQEEEEPAQMQEEEEPAQMQEEEEPVQAKSNAAKTTRRANPKLSKQIKASAGHGKKMSPPLRSEMEANFGQDFSQVHIHTDAQAIQMTKDLGAQAFTHGKDIYFNAGKFNPDSAAGKHLLAHELTHVVQQQGGPKKPK